MNTQWMNCREAAALWHVSERWVTNLCRTGKIPEAHKEKRQWLLPVGTEKPVDSRIRNGRYQKVNHAALLPLPIGISDYCKASTDYYYVDKTLLIRDFLNQRPLVSLFTRPRRFGKTLNMDMLRVFFEKTDQDTSIYFQDKNIWKCGPAYQRHQGQYPVIFLSFKDVKFSTWEETLEKLTELLQKEFGRHSELLQSTHIAEFERSYYRKVIEGQASKVELTSALANLSQMLHEHHGIAPIIIIDEYDPPIEQGYHKNYYEEIILFMRSLFSGGFKDNRHLSYGFLTGILRVAQESIFSGMNNLKINSILESNYSSYFGFTPEEVQAMADYYGVPEKYEEICDWYDGYRFGNQEIFNPWSVISYFDNDCIPDTYWISTGNNEILHDLLAHTSEELSGELNLLLQGQSVLTQVDANVVYPQLAQNPSFLYSFLLVAGYLKHRPTPSVLSGIRMCEVSIPNREIAAVYKKEVLDKLLQINGALTSSAYRIQKALVAEDTTLLQESLQSFLYQTISFYDSSNESFYQGLLSGLLALLDDRYRVTSNREAGNGRYDFQLYPMSQKLPGILMELKVSKADTEEQLQIYAEKALRQIEDRKYAISMVQEGVSRILCYGIAFSGKKVKICEKCV